MPSVKRAHLGYFAELKNSKNRRKPGAWRESGTLHEGGFVGILRNLKNSKNRRKPGAWSESGTLHVGGFVGILRNLK